MTGDRNNAMTSEMEDALFARWAPQASLPGPRPSRAEVRVWLRAARQAVARER